MKASRVSYDVALFTFAIACALWGHQHVQSAWFPFAAVLAVLGLAAIVCTVPLAPALPKRRRRIPRVGEVRDVTLPPDFANPHRFIVGLPLEDTGDMACQCEPLVARVNRSGRCQVCGFLATVKPHIHTRQEYDPSWLELDA
jgi:hypothetical protein